MYIHKPTVSLLFYFFSETLSCPPGYFACKNGLCILQRDVCNGYPNCKDKSDESMHWASCKRGRSLLPLGFWLIWHNHELSVVCCCLALLSLSSSLALVSPVEGLLATYMYIILLCAWNITSISTVSLK